MTNAQLVPTRVGMILSLDLQNIGLHPCPHTRGDDPAESGSENHSAPLSPHAWG